MTPFNKMLRLAMPVVCTLGLGAAAMGQTATDANKPALPASGNTMSSPTMGTQTTTTTPMQPTASMTKSKGSTPRIPASETFKSVADASAHCPGGTVVWSTLSKTKTYHMSSSKYYGKTKHGAYVCQQDAQTAGFRQLKN